MRQNLTLPTEFSESDKQFFVARTRLDPWFGCWIWLREVNVKGYGRVALPGKWQTRYFAHRLSYAMFIGSVPDGMLVCHHCDVRLCVNPQHLFIGTAHDNTQDMLQKGRNFTGERPKGDVHHWAKLTDAQVIEVWHLRSEGQTMPQIAKRYSVTPGCIWHILHSRNRKHVNVPQLPSINQICMP